MAVAVDVLTLDTVTVSVWYCETKKPRPWEGKGFLLTTRAMSGSGAGENRPVRVSSI